MCILFGQSLADYASQRSLHNAPVFRLLRKVAVNGTHQCDFLNFCGASVPTNEISTSYAVPFNWTSCVLNDKCRISPFPAHLQVSFVELSQLESGANNSNTCLLFGQRDSE